jgi:hypothetical protein
MPLPRPATAALVLLGLLAGPALATAATLGSTLAVSTEIAPTCRLSGSLPGGGIAAVPGAGGPAIALTCTKGVFAVVMPRLPGEHAALLHAGGAGSPPVLAVDRRGSTPRPGPSASDHPTIITTIHF